MRDTAHQLGSTMRARSIALALTIFALCTTTVPPVAAQQRYRVTDLGTLGGGFIGESSRATAVNYRGQVVGFSTREPFGSNFPFLYDSGVMRELKIPEARGTLGSHAWAINNRGWVTGFGSLPESATCSGCTRAYIHHGRTTKFLGHLGGQKTGEDMSGGYGINRAGHVTGITSVSVPGGTVEGHAFIYNGKRMRDLGTLGGTGSVGFAINRWGWVAGASTLPGDTVTHAFVYRGGVMHDLGTLGTSIYGRSYSSATAINNKGWVTGATSKTGEPFNQAFIYDGKTMRGLGAETASGNDINSRGWVVGSMRIEVDGEPQVHAFLYDGTAVRNLNDLLEGGSQWTLREALGMNDRGQIVGWATRGTDTDRRAFLLTAVVPTE